jgi:hypothetical protein
MPDSRVVTRFGALNADNLEAELNEIWGGSLFGHGQIILLVCISEDLVESSSNLAGNRRRSDEALVFICYCIKYNVVL